MKIKTRALIYLLFVVAWVAACILVPRFGLWWLAPAAIMTPVMVAVDVQDFRERRRRKNKEVADKIMRVMEIMHRSQCGLCGKTFPSKVGGEQVCRDCSVAPFDVYERRLRIRITKEEDHG